MQIYQDNLIVEMYSKYEGHLHGFKKILVKKQTSYQELAIIDTHVFGRCLFLDGKMQSSQLDEYIYHELLVHPAIITHNKVKQVLIIGGGEGATLREVLRYKEVEKVDMVDIDAEVIDFAKEYLSAWHENSFIDSRANIVIDDGRKFLEKQNYKYDVIIIDISDPVWEGPAYMLYTLEFYKLAAKCLQKNGVLVLQAGSSSIVSGDIMAAIYQTLKQVFPQVYAYEASIPSFDMPWGFCLASYEHSPKELNSKIVEERLTNKEITVLRAYDGEAHLGLFNITKALRALLNKGNRIIRDEQAIFTPEI